jgi:O-antigen/teichoic acid export membrane protein
MLTSLVGAALGVPLAHLLGRGRPDVIEFIEIGLYLLPLAVFFQTLYGVAVADERWGLIMVTRVLSTGLAAGAIVILSLVGALNVRTAAVTYIVSGVLAGLPFAIELRGSRPWRFQRRVALTGLSFGVRTWIATLGSVGSLQLDQLLMAGLVSSRQLGLYALAATVSGTTAILAGGTANALLPRVAAGESDLIGRASRVTLLVVALCTLAIGATSPILVPFVFGRPFTAMIPMLLILLGAGLFSSPAVILGSALIAGGNPSAMARAQLAGLIVTVPALIVVLPVAQGIGAAWVSFAAYIVTFGILLRATVQTFDLSYRTLLIASPADLRWLSAYVGSIGRTATRPWTQARAERNIHH